MSIKTKIMCGLLAFGAAATTYAQERFNIYGFMDATYSQTFGIAENNPLQGEPFLEPFPEYVTGDVNVYFDFNPTPETRALIEVNFNSSSQDRGQSIGNLGGIEWGEISAEQEAQMVVSGSDGQPQINPVTNEVMTVSDLRGLEEAGFAAPGSADAFIQGLRAGVGGGLDGGDKSYQDSEFHHAMILERAWFEYAINDAVNFRVGRFITPAGIWNVDHGSPIITTVSQPNQTSFFPIFPERQQGVMLFGTTFLGDHDLSYNAYVSTGRFQDGVGGPVEFDQDLDFEDYAVGGHVGLRLDYLDGVNIGASGMKGSVRREEKFTSVRAISGAEQVGIANGQITPDGTWATHYRFTPAEYNREMVGGLDLKVEADGLTVQGEVNYRYVENMLENAFQSGGGYTDYLGFYGLVSYFIPMTPKYGVTPYALFEQITWNEPQNTVRRPATFDTSFDPERPSGGLASFPINGWNTYMIGLNWSLGSNYRIKTEVTYGQLLVQDPSELDPRLPPLPYEQGDLDVTTFSTQFTMAF